MPDRLERRNHARKKKRNKKYREHLKLLEDHIQYYTPSASGNRELEERDWELAYDRPDYWKKSPKTYYVRTYPRQGNGISFTGSSLIFSYGIIKVKSIKGMYRKIYDLWWLAD